MSRIVEIRVYNLKPGSRDEFHSLVIEHSIPMLARWKVDVVRYGPSLADENSYYLMRSFATLEHRQQSEDAIYASAEWREGPRESIVSLIESYAETVIEVDEMAVEGLRG